MFQEELRESFAPVKRKPPFSKTIAFICSLNLHLCMLFRLRKAKREWQEEQWADQRKDKEEAAAKYRKRMEEKAKEKEEKNKLNEQGKTDETKVDERYSREAQDFVRCRLFYFTFQLLLHIHCYSF